MVRRQMRTLLPVLMCCAVTVLSRICRAQNAPPVPADSAMPAPAATGPETIEVEAPRLMTFEMQPTNGTFAGAASGPQGALDQGPIERRDFLQHLFDRVQGGVHALTGSNGGPT